MASHPGRYCNSQIYCRTGFRLCVPPRVERLLAHQPAVFVVVTFICLVCLAVLVTSKVLPCGSITLGWTNYQISQ